jgi:hypothetical protein
MEEILKADMLEKMVNFLVLSLLFRDPNSISHA